MDYLLVSKMNQFYQWQNELLIESFLYRNLAQKLKLCLYADLNLKNSKYYLNSLQLNLPVYNIPDYGFEFGYGKINIFYSIENLLYNKLISSSFALMESDVVIHKEINEQYETDYPSIFFSKNEFFDYKNFLEEIPNFCEIFDVTEDLLKEQWPYLGSIIVFNKLEDKFFGLLKDHVANCACAQMQQNGKVHEKTYKIMLAVAIIKNKNLLNMKYIDYGETNMLDNETNFNFIHYQKGLPPYFHKFMFQNFNLAYGDPFDVIRMNPSTYAAYYIHDIAGSYLKKIGRKLEPILVI